MSSFWKDDILCHMEPISLELVKLDRGTNDYAGKSNGLSAGSGD